MSLTERIARGIKATLLARIVKIGAESALIIVLARVLLTPDEYGLLYFALNVVGLLSILSSLGLPSSGARYVTEYDEADPGQVPHVVRLSLGYLLGLAMVVGGVLAVGHVPIASLLGESDLAPLLLIGVLYVLFKAVTQYLINIFQGFSRVTWSAVINSTIAVGQAVFAIGFVLLGLGVAGAMAGYVVGYGLAAVIGLYVLYTRFYRTYDPAPEPEEGIGRRIVEYSVPLTVARGAAMLDKQVDTILVGLLLNTTAVGYYTLGKQVSMVVGAVAASVGFTISPTFGEQKVGGNPERSARLYETALEHMLLLYIPGAVGLVLVAEPMIVHVFGSDYLGAVPVVQVLAVFVLVHAITGITSDGLDFLGRARERAVVKGILAVANAVLNVVLIPMVGVVGAAIATVITHTVYTTANVYLISQELPIDFTGIGRTTVGACLVTGVMAVGVTVAVPYVTGILSLLAVVGLGVAIWAVLSVAGGLLKLARVASFLR